MCVLDSQSTTTKCDSMRHIALYGDMYPVPTREASDTEVNLPEWQGDNDKRSVNVCGAVSRTSVIKIETRIRSGPQSSRASILAAVVPPYVGEAATCAADY